jgi:hypothetical protein
VVLEEICLSPMIGLTELEHDWRTKRVNRTRVVNGLLDLADHSPGGACTSVRILYLDSGMLEAPKGETAKNIVARLPCLRHLVVFGANWVAFAASIVETLTQGADLKKTMPSIEIITISASHIDSSDGDHRAMHVQPAHLAMWRLITLKSTPAPNRRAHTLRNIAFALSPVDTTNSYGDDISRFPQVNLLPKGMSFPDIRTKDGGNYIIRVHWSGYTYHLTRNLVSLLVYV